MISIKKFIRIELTMRAWWNAVPGMLIVMERIPAISPLYKPSIVTKRVFDSKLTSISQMLQNVTWTKTEPGLNGAMFR